MVWLLVLSVRGGDIWHPQAGMVGRIISCPCFVHFLFRFRKAAVIYAASQANCCEVGKRYLIVD